MGFPYWITFLRAAITADLRARALPVPFRSTVLESKSADFRAFARVGSWSGEKFVLKDWRAASDSDDHYEFAIER
jgi:hypothetical protein